MKAYDHVLSKWREIKIVFVCSSLIWQRHLMMQTVIKPAEIQNKVLYPNCQIYVTAIKLSLPTNSPAATSWIRCDKDCIDSGRNPSDKCDGGNCDTYPWWQCRGCMTGPDRTVYPVSWDSIPALCMTFPEGHSCVKETLKPQMSLLKPVLSVRTITVRELQIRNE